MALLQFSTTTAHLSVHGLRGLMATEEIAHLISRFFSLRVPFERITTDIDGFESQQLLHLDLATSQ